MESLNLVTYNHNMKTNLLNQILATNLRSYRQRLGISQEKLSELLDVHRNTVALLEAGKRGISLELLEKLAQVLHCEPYELLKPAVI